MIIKLAGMGVVFLASAAIGFSLGECYKAREAELANLSDAVEMMKSELSYTNLPIRDIIAGVAPFVRGQCSELFALMVSEMESDIPPAQAWENALERKAYSMSLKKGDLELLKSSDYLFSAYELSEQQSRLEELKTRVHILLSRARDAAAKNTRLARMMGLYGGALLCVIMF